MKLCEIDRLLLAVVVSVLNICVAQATETEAKRINVLFITVDDLSGRPVHISHGGLPVREALA